jgi:hypothetical protein
MTATVTMMAEVTLSISSEAIEVIGRGAIVCIKLDYEAKKYGEKLSIVSNDHTMAHSRHVATFISDSDEN